MAKKSQGISQVTFCNISENRLELASALGFGAVASVSEDFEKGHHGADLAVKATGVAQVAGRLTSYIANGGKVLFFGECLSDAKIDIAPFEVVRGQLPLVG